MRRLRLTLTKNDGVFRLKILIGEQIKTHPASLVGSVSAFFDVEIDLLIAYDDRKTSSVCENGNK